MTPTTITITRGRALSQVSDGDVPRDVSAEAVTGRDVMGRTPSAPQKPSGAGVAVGWRLGEEGGDGGAEGGDGAGLMGV